MPTGSRRRPSVAGCGIRLVALGVTLVLGGLAVAVLYEVLRRFPRAWPALGAAVSLVFVVSAR